jgi:hypothetical protein
MCMKKERKYLTNKKLAFDGALISVACIFFYAQLVMLYVVTRSSVFIFSAMGKGEWEGILLANGVSLIYSVAVISVIVSLITSIMGAAAALVLGKALLHFNPSGHTVRAFIISLLLSVLLSISVDTLIDLFLIPQMMSRYPEAFLFWIAFPSLIFIVANLIGGMALNRSYIVNH